MTIHYQDPTERKGATALCGVPVQKFRVNVVETWGSTPGGVFVNCPECLLHRPAKRKRRGVINSGRKFR